MHVTARPDRLDGKDVFRRDEVLHVWVGGPDKAYAMDTSYAQYAGTGFYPVLETMNLKNDDPAAPEPHSSIYEGRYGRLRVDYTCTTGVGSSNQASTLDDEAVNTITAGCAHAFGMLKLADGESVGVNMGRYTTINPVAEQCWWCRCYVVLTMLRRVSLKLNGVAYNTSVIRQRAMGTERIRWQLESGEIVKEEWPQEGLTWVKETKEKATKR